MGGKSDGEPGVDAAALLNAVAEALTTPAGDDPRAGLEAALAELTGRLRLSAGWVWLRDGDSGAYYAAATYGLPPYLRAPVRMAGGEICWCLEAFAAGRLAPGNVSVMHCSRLAAARTEQERVATHGLRSHATVPLTFRGHLLGILNVTAPGERALTDAELTLLSAAAAQISVAVERSRLAEEAAGRAQAEERARLARDLHDTLAQELTGIALHLEGARNALDAGDVARTRERLERALIRTRESLEEARRSVLALRRGAALGGRALPDALRALARGFTADTGLPCPVQVIVAEDAPPLPARVEEELFRIAQEALANVRRHAAPRGATGAAVTLDQTAEATKMTVEDDGPGLHPDSAVALQGGGHGLPGMRERARALGGSVQVGTEQGVRIIVQVPMSPAGEAGT